MSLEIADLQLREVKTDERGRATLGSDYAAQTVPIAIPPWQDSIEELQPYHVRHGFSGVSKQGRFDLWAERRTGIHWRNKPFTGRWFYEHLREQEGRGPIDDYNALSELAQGGGIVTVEDPEIPGSNHNVVRIGRVLPNTPITARRYEGKDEDGNEEFLKTVEMVDVFEVSEDEYPRLFRNGPTRGSIRRWQTNRHIPREVYRELIN